MTDIRISDLPAAVLPLQGNEYVVIVQNGITCRTPITTLTVLANYSKAALPSASVPGTLIYVTDEVAGAIPAYADGTNWRRISDRAIVS